MPRRNTIPNVFDYWGNAVQMSLVMAEAQSVIAMRLMGMVGLWSVTAQEDKRMVSEKVFAMTKAMTDAGKVGLRGGSPDQVTAAAIRPIRQATRANNRRLAKRGLKRA